MRVALYASLLAGLLLVAQMPATGIQHSEPGSGLAAREPISSPPAVPDCIIGPDDVLIIKVYDAPDVSGEYRVSPTGQVDLPLLSEAVLAAGLTPARLSEEISQKYREAEIITHPRVTVAVKESRVHAVSIAGAVKRPQIYPVFGKTTLLDVLAQAEGLAEDAGNSATVTRGATALQAFQQTHACESTAQQAYCESTFKVDLGQLIQSGDPSVNVELYAGDRVVVQQAGIVYVVGAVNRPGGFPLKNGQKDMTVLQAVALAEDLKPIAAGKKALIIHKNPAGADDRKEVAVNLDSVLAGHENDLKLHANDILFVPESTGKKALRRGAEAAVTAATYGFIYRW
jgi:polysaccharide export outer membrane protein